LDKTYSGTIELGKATPTMDGESEPVKVLSFEGITEEDILKVRDGFLGESEQIPPMFSALKKDGKRLYKLARKGEEVEREPRKIRIEKFETTNVNLPFIDFLIECSKGTYVRVIADDFGKRLNNAAYLKKLRREKIGAYSVEDAITIGEFEEFIRNRKTADDE
jgi:tRNA pseudouridine55 synthase